MARTRCPRCGADVQEDMPACPKCGFPLQDPLREESAPGGTASSASPQRRQDRHALEVGVVEQ